MELKVHITLNTHSTEETAHVGEAIGRSLRPGITISLVGPLGAGKTVLAGGIFRGLGVEEQVFSPTFVLYEEFQGRMPAVHVDLYRLEHEAEIGELGVYERLGRDAVVVVEWGDRSDMLLAASDIVIRLGYLTETTRSIEVACSDGVAALFRKGENWSS